MQFHDQNLFFKLPVCFYYWCNLNTIHKWSEDLQITYQNGGLSRVGIVYNIVKLSVQWKINRGLHYSHRSEATYNTYIRLLV